MQIAGTLFDPGLSGGGATQTQPLSYTASATLTSANTNVLARVDCTSANVTITLPYASSVPAGTQYTVKRIDSSANLITLTASGSDVIDGQTAHILTLPYSSITVSAYASGWDII